MKILGLGLAMVDQQKWMKKSEKAGRKFLSRHFSPSEIEYCNGKRNPLIHYSVRWACKEAFLQALGREEKISNFMKMIEVLADSSGIPRVQARPAVLSIQKHWKIQQIKASLSHSDAYSIAQVIVLGEAT
jgi:holo-[acyl-carrier protein] synthase